MHLISFLAYNYVLKKKKVRLKICNVLGYFAGSVSGTSDSWSWGGEFRLHIGYRDYLKKWKHVIFKINENYLKERKI